MTSRSGGYHTWRRREASKRGQEDEKLVAVIRDIQENVAKYRYGSPRVTKELHRRGHNRVARLMPSASSSESQWA